MICKALNDIGSIVAMLLEKSGHDAIIILQGDLAAGKTTLVKAIAAHMGLNDAVTSPTFSLQQNYADRLYHYDIYNQGLENFMALGLFEELEKEGLHCIEWGDERLVKLVKEAGFKVVHVAIEKRENQRCYRIENA